MIFDIITIFPGFFGSILEHGLLKRAIGSSEIAVNLHDLRDFTSDAHRSVDGRPFGGGPGMVFKPEPLFRAVESIESSREVTSGEAARVVLLTPQGRVFNQALAAELSREHALILICSRYEGVDERVAAHLATDEISIGDYVLSGGELPAAVLMEAVTRLLPGVLGNEESKLAESFQELPALAASGTRAGLLDFPQYTRPAEFRRWKVPEVLLSGNHSQIERWRRRQSLLKTSVKRPDLLEKAGISAEELRAAREEEEFAAREL